jgi:ankyrin repeat protein
MHLAAAAGHASLLTLLITPSTLDVRDSNHYTALQLAVKHRKLEAAAVLVAAGASLGEAWDFRMGCDPFSLAMFPLANGDSTQMPLLILNALLAAPRSAWLLQQIVRPSALHRAATTGCSQLVARMVQVGADRDAVNAIDLTPLHTAAFNGHAHLVPLPAIPGNIEEPDYAGASALHVAAT